MNKKMKLPGTFRTKKETKPEEIEEIIQKTLVDKVVVEDIAKKVKEYLEDTKICEMLKLTFEKSYDLEKGKQFKTKTVKESDRQNSYQVSLDDDYDLYDVELTDIIENIIMSDSGLKAKDILYNDEERFFSVLGDNVAYKLEITVRDDRTFLEDDKTGKVYWYYNPEISGEVRYVRFNKKHHDMLIELLKENGYVVTIDFDEREE